MCKPSNELGLTTNIKVWKLVSATGGKNIWKKKNILKSNILVLISKV